MKTFRSNLDDKVMKTRQSFIIRIAQEAFNRAVYERFVKVDDCTVWVLREESVKYNEHKARATINQIAMVMLSMGIKGEEIVCDCREELINLIARLLQEHLLGHPETDRVRNPLFRYGFLFFRRRTTSEGIDFTNALIKALDEFAKRRKLSRSESMRRVGSYVKVQRKEKAEEELLTQQGDTSPNLIELTPQDDYDVLFDPNTGLCFDPLNNIWFNPENGFIYEPVPFNVPLATQGENFEIPLQVSGNTRSQFNPFLDGGEEPIPEDVIKESERLASQQKVGPREIEGYVLYDVPSDGNCFYHAVIDQLRKIKHPFLNDIPSGTEPHDMLRLRAQGEAFQDKEWSDVKEISKLIQTLNVIIAIVDTRSPEWGYQYYYTNESGEFIDLRSVGIPLSISVIKFAYTGNHYLSVRKDPVELGFEHVQNVNDQDLTGGNFVTVTSVSAESSSTTDSQLNPFSDNTGVGTQGSNPSVQTNGNPFLSTEQSEAPTMYAGLNPFSTPSWSDQSPCTFFGRPGESSSFPTSQYGVGSAQRDYISC